MLVLKGEPSDGSPFFLSARFDFGVKTCYNRFTNKKETNKNNMALQQTATAAVRLVRVTNLTEREADALVQEFQLHPHDREALFDVPAQPLVRSYREYCLAVVPWPVYHVKENDLRAAAIRFIVADGHVAVVTDATLPPLEDHVQSLLTTLPSAGQTAALTTALMLLQLAKWTAGSAPLFLRQLSPRINDPDRLIFIQALQSASAALLDLADRLTTLQLSTTEAALTYRLAGHLLSHTATQLAGQHRLPVRHVTAPAVMLPRLVGGYVVASAVVALLVLMAVR